MTDGQEYEVNMEKIVLGTLILKFSLPMILVDQLNEVCDTARAKEVSFNDQLAGKIENEYALTHLLDDTTKGMFLGFFKEYMNRTNKPEAWIPHLDHVWYNDMVAGEYNPPHFHRTATSDFGLSSVLMLKRPETYGKEIARNDTPRNGYLNLISGTQDPLSASMYQVDVQVGDFYIFPFTLMHSVNPFNGTDEIRRTLSWNCNLYKEPVFDLSKPQVVEEKEI